MKAYSVAFTHKIVLSSYFLLILLNMLTIAWLNPPEKFPISLSLILYVGPLLVTIKGILHGIPKAHLYTSFIALFYLGHASVKIWENEQMLLSLFLLTLSLILFISCLTFTKKAISQNKKDLS